MRPYVIINIAMSADGKISTKEHRQTKISGEQDFARVDRLRSDCDAIMVGIGTVLADDSSLRLKNPNLIEKRAAAGKEEQPMRIVVDSKARMPLDGDIFKKGTGKRVIFVSETAPKNRIEPLSEKAIVIPAGDTKIDLNLALDKLSEMGVKKLMVEGGGTLIWSFVSQKLFDEIRVFIGALIIGGAEAPTFVDGNGFTRTEEFTRLQLQNIEKIDEGVLITWIKKDE
ncbi:MAG TPA: 2,5-diamino-6-(ribosylamino)-4(3H)-pyrimidinone 5'-phosphate reductase [Methanocorpusculum sp.]|nr:2,5-diamino-6-(ribosylamino)-4(3H)-pyrimidinone 5'-phosphate reductase [Methanocorpusculum sp.]